MRRAMIAATIALTCVAFTVDAQDKAPAGSSERGKKLYVDYGCYSCHGTHGQGGERGSGPKIYPNPFPWAGFLQQMRKPRQDMPAYIEKWVSDQDVADMYAYLLAIKAAPAAKDIPLLNGL
jgi:mono/diheme cytochrome c family protein